MSDSEDLECSAKGSSSVDRKNERYPRAKTEFADDVTRKAKKVKNGKERFIIGAASDDESDSDTEISISAQADIMFYGTTPPREIRRMKHKFPKSNKKESKSQSYHQSSTPKEKRKAVHCHKKDYIRKISQDYPLEDEKHRYPRRVPSISVNSPNIYKSIKSVPTLLNKHHHVSDDSDSARSFSKSRSFGDIVKVPNCPPGRLHFMKTFQLLVRLGDRHGRRDSRRAINKQNDTDDQPENWQIHFDQVLWLELQARRFGRRIEEQDCYLLEERKDVDQSLNEIIHFYFPNQLEQYDSQYARKFSQHEKSLKAGEEADEAKASQQHEDQSKTAEKNLPFLPHDVGHYCSTIDDHFTGSIQHIAMHIIIMLLKKIDDAAALYPTTKALAQSQPKYLDVKFVKNYETLNVWLNICKELYHKLQVVASLVDVNVEDNKTWEDWFDHGLGKSHNLMLI